MAWSPQTSPAGHLRTWHWELIAISYVCRGSTTAVASGSLNRCGFSPPAQLLQYLPAQIAMKIEPVSRLGERSLLRPSSLSRDWPTLQGLVTLLDRSRSRNSVLLAPALL